MMAFAVLTVVLLFANAFVTTYIVLTLKLYKVGEEELDLNLAPSIKVLSELPVQRRRMGPREHAPHLHLRREHQVRGRRRKGAPTALRQGSRAQLNCWKGH